MNYRDAKLFLSNHEGLAEVLQRREGKKRCVEWSGVEFTLRSVLVSVVHRIRTQTGYK